MKFLLKFNRQLLIIKQRDVIMVKKYSYGDVIMSINENDSRVRRTKKLIRQGLVELSQTKSVNKMLKRS
jgi:hypothetical protein